MTEAQRAGNEIHDHLCPLQGGWGLGYPLRRWTWREKSRSTLLTMVFAEGTWGRRCQKGKRYSSQWSLESSPTTPSVNNQPSAFLSQTPNKARRNSWPLRTHKTKEHLFHIKHNKIHLPEMPSCILLILRSGGPFQNKTWCHYGFPPLQAHPVKSSRQILVCDVMKTYWLIFCSGMLEPAPTRLQLLHVQGFCKPVVKHNDINLQLNKLHLKTKIINTHNAFLPNDFTTSHCLSSFLKLFILSVQ